jgi:hypothetical protein
MEKAVEERTTMNKRGFTTPAILPASPVFAASAVWAVLVVLVVLAGAIVGRAQSGLTLSQVLVITREDVKPGKGMAHEQIEKGFARALAKHKVQPYLAMEALSGTSGEAMFISGYASFAEFEKDNQAIGKAVNGPSKAEFAGLDQQEADTVSGMQTWVAVYRPDLSYRADHLMSMLPQSRYFQVLNFRVRMGRDDDFAEGSKLYLGAFEKLKSERAYVMYQVVMGAPAGTYLLFTPLKSLKELDDEMAGEKVFMEAMGAENMQRLEKRSGDVFLSTKADLYAFNPEMSNVSKEFAAGDPKYWTPKPPPVVPKNLPVLPNPPRRDGQNP